VRLDTGDNGGVDPITAFVALRNSWVTTIKNDLSTLLLSRLNDAVDALKGLLGDDRTKIGVRQVARTALELASTLDELRDPLLRLADEDSSAESHAALTSCTESSTSQLVEGSLLVSIREDGAVVLGSHVGLDALAICSGASVDVLTSGVGTDEGDSADARIIAEVVDGVMSTVNDVEHTIGETSLLSKASEDERSGRSLLGGLHDHGVTAGVGDGEHPEGNHSREIEGADAGHDTKGLAIRVSVDIAGELLESLTLEVRSKTARVLDDFETTEDGTLSISNDLTVLSDNGIDQSLLVVADELLKLEHVALAHANGGVTPSRECSSGSISSGLQLLRSGLGNESSNLASSRVDNLEPLVSVGLHELTIDEERQLRNRVGGRRELSGEELGRLQSTCEHFEA